jgi:hypothetical protein
MAKLTASQLRILRYLRDGDRISRHWGKLTGNWNVAGDWGRDRLPNTTIQSLLKARLVKKTDRIGDWYYLLLTNAGRAALAAKDGQS